MTFRQIAYRNVVRNKRTYAAFFLSSAFSVMIFFVCALFLFNPGVREGMIYAAAAQAFTAAECIMYVFSIFFVLYSVGSFLKSRKREFGILLLHGMTEGQLNRMIFLETMLIGSGAIAAGVAAGMLFGKLFLMIGSHVIGIGPLPFELPWQALALTVGSFALLFFLISLRTSRLLRTNRLIELFQAGQKPKSEPKASAGLSLLAAALLGVSYYMAVTATAATVYVRMLPVTAMTIAGTYFFYTQLSVYLLKRWTRNRRFFWNRTNIVTIASLAYRMKDNARMFFMVTVISTVSFCSVGVFASINSLLKHFHADYPAAVGYLSKPGNTDEQRHLEEIRTELAQRGLPYETVSIAVKYAPVASSDAAMPTETLPLVAYSDYRQAIEAAGFPFGEPQPADGEALVFISSQRTKAFLDMRKPVSYTLAENGLTVREIGYAEHVPIPDHLLPGLPSPNDADFGGVVVSDRVFGEIKTPARTETYTGFYVRDYERTVGLAAQLVEHGEMRYDEGRPYAMTVSGTLLVMQRSLYSVLLFAALLVGAVFFIAAGSFLYFRLYADLDYDRRQYLTIAKVGLTDRELGTIVTRQLAILFFVPIAMAIVHSIFAFIALQSFFILSIAAGMGAVLVSFFVAQVLYFFFIRNRYLRNLRKSLL